MTLTQQGAPETSASPRAKSPLMGEVLPGGERRKVPLQFFLSEALLKTVWLDMIRYSVHFTDFAYKLSDWSTFLRQLPPEVEGIYVRSHPVQGPLPKLARVEGALRYVPEQFLRHYTTIAGKFEDYFARFGASSRREFRRQVSRYRELCGGKMPIKEYRRVEEMDEFYRHARSVSARSYQEVIMRGGFPEAVGEPHDLRRLAEQDGMRGYVLFHGEMPVAYHYLRHHNGVLREPLYAYDMEYRKWGVGAVLQFCILEQWFEQGCYRMLDHGPGHDYHQTVFATDSIACADLYFLRPTVRNRLIVRLHSATDALSRGTGVLLDKLHLKAAVKRLMWSKY